MMIVIYDDDYDSCQPLVLPLMDTRCARHEVNILKYVCSCVVLNAYIHTGYLSMLPLVLLQSAGNRPVDPNFVLILSLYDDRETYLPSPRATSTNSRSNYSYKRSKKNKDLEEKQPKRTK